MWFGILGPLLVCDGDSVISVPAARQRVLLAALLVRAGTAVSVDALAEMMWDGTPPAGAVTTLRSHVMRLRRVLGPKAGARVVTRYPGYLVEAAENEVDLLRFTCLCREGGTAVRAGDWGRAGRILSEALGLWRGDPLADITSELLRRNELPGLEQLRLQAVEWRMDAGLHLGSHAELVPELQALTAHHSLRERFHAQLMLALVRCSRPAEALEAYQHARSVLAEEVGAEPGPELRELHQRILSEDPTLAVAHPVTLAAGRSGAVKPQELPAPVAHFVGRATELAALTGLLDRFSAHGPEAIIISAIDGTAGVGKTALAVHWAHEVAAGFPDGQLFVDLRGYDPDRPMLAAQALAGFLLALGVPGRDIPAREDERAALYRSLLAGRRMLVVLDNAGSVEQVRPLIPGAPACAVMVTSRDALAGLVARDGATRLDLDLLPLEDAVGLLRTLVGSRVDADPGAAVVLAGRCCRLPLALRVAAELAASRRSVSLTELADELADQQRRLDLLDAGGDPRTGVRAVFSWSYQHLDAGTARTFRLFGLHPGPDLDPYAAAALAGTTLQQACHGLDLLARAHLIQPAGPGRHGMHDLLRGYARELAATLDTEDERQGALTRLFDHYLHAAAAAMDVLYPGERHRRPRVPAPPASPAPPLAEPVAARAWLDAERPCLAAATAHAAGHGWPVHATRLAATVFRHLEVAGHYPEIVAMHGHACRAARLVGDREAEAKALQDLTVVDLRQGRYQQAGDQLRQALKLFREAGNRAGEAGALGNLGIICFHQGRFGEAARRGEQALASYRQVGDRFGEARALNNLGFATLFLGRYQQADDYLRQALVLSRQVGDHAITVYSLVNLGLIDLRQERYRPAVAHLAEALALSRETGNPTGEAHSLLNLGLADLRQGQRGQVIGQLRQALAISRELGDRSLEAEALNGLGEVFLVTGRTARARAWHRAALALASRTGDKYEQARAQSGLGCSYHVTGDTGRARRHWEHAHALFASLGVPEAGQVRAQLTALDLRPPT